jgi:hypothetical protein
MALRDRKATLIAALKAYVYSGSMTVASASRYEARYRACRSFDEQEVVRKDVQHTVSGFRVEPKTAYDKLRADDDSDDEDDDPPALKAALARAGLSFLPKKRDPAV